MIATQFDTAGGNGQGIRICDLIKGDNIAYGTEIMVQKEDGTYDHYKYLKECYYPAPIDDFLPGWGDGGEELAERVLEPGTTFWYNGTADSSVTISGQVLAASDKTVEIPGGKVSMIANPYPFAPNPNDLTWTGLTYGDEIMVMKADGTYDHYKWLAECYYPAPVDDFLPGWGDGGEELIETGVIPVGQGAWIQPAANLTLKWESPIK